MTRTKFLLATALVAPIALSATAQAADLPAPVYEPVAPIVAPVVSPFTWGGLYVGATAGYGWADLETGEDDDFDFDFDDGDDDSDLEGFLGGPLVGFNAQFGSFVVGVEGDFTWTNIDLEDGGRSGALTAAEAARLNAIQNQVVFLPGDTVDFEDAIEVDWLATIRGRAGFAFDRFMVYGTGGIAFADIDGNFTGTIRDRNNPNNVLMTGRNNDEDETTVGYTLGAGVEAAFTDNLTARVEYLFYNFEEDDADNNENSAFRLRGVDEVDIHTVRAGLTFKFNGLFQ